jgi:hypothetical protein
MFVARWIIEAKFGHKNETVALCRRWQAEVGDRVKLKTTTRVLTGSVGVSESRLEFESVCASLADLERSWAEMANLPAHTQFSKDLEPHIVSGSNRWEILRIVEG